MGDKMLVVVVTRYWPTALSVVRSLGAAGFCVDLVASISEPGAADIAAASKYVRKYTESVCKNVKKLDDPGLMPALLEYENNKREEKPVLFPTDDYTASFIDRHRLRLADIFRMPEAGGGADGAITEFMNKQVQSRLATEAGLKCPEEWLISLEHELEIPSDMVYPCFVKPAESVTGYKGDMAKCLDYNELKRHLQKLRSKNPDRAVIVQRFLQIDYELDIGGVSSRDGVLIPAVIRKTCIARHERGVTAAGTIEPADMISEIYENICAMMASCRYVGMFDLEINVAGGEFYFGELNFRSGGPNYAYYLSGINLPEIAVKVIAGGSLPAIEAVSIEFGRNFVSEKVLWKEYFKNRMSAVEVARTIRTADVGLIESSDDPQPVKLFRKDISDQIRKKHLKRAKGAIKKIIRHAAPVMKAYPQCRPGNSRKKSSKTRVMVMGRNYSSNLCMARSLGMAGYDVEVMRVFSRSPAKDDTLAKMTPDAYSRYVKAFHSCTLRGKTQNGADALVKVSDKTKKMLLIPTDDISAYIIDESYDRLGRYYVLPSVRETQGELCKLMSKTEQKKLAADCGLPAPFSTLVTCHDGRYEIPDNMRYPCFIKPDVSCKSSKKRMKRCESAEELRMALDEIAQTAEPDLLIEEYVDVRREISVLGLSADGNVICPGIIQATSGGQGARRGVAATGVSIAPADNDITDADMMQKLRDFMVSTGYNGLFDIDLVETSDGTIYFLEVNLRYGASGYVVTCEGINLPGLYADHMLNRTPIPAEDEILAQRTTADKALSFISEKVLLENYKDGAADLSDTEAALASGDVHFVYDDRDRKPYRFYMKAFNKIKRNKQSAGQ